MTFEEATAAGRALFEAERPGDVWEAVDWCVRNYYLITAVRRAKQPQPPPPER